MNQVIEKFAAFSGFVATAAALFYVIDQYLFF